MQHSARSQGDGSQPRGSQPEEGPYWSLMFEVHPLHRCSRPRLRQPPSAFGLLGVRTAGKACCFPSWLQRCTTSCLQ